MAAASSASSLVPAPPLSKEACLATAEDSDGVAALLRALARDSYCVVRAEEMRALLGQAAVAELPAMRAFYDEAVPQRDEKNAAIYPYKGALCSYYTDAADPPRRSTAHDSEQWPGDVVEHVDPTTADATVSHLRVHKQWPPAADTNAAFGALRRLMFALLDSPSEIEWSPGGAWEAMMTGYRVSKRPEGDGDGDPGPEGVHQDNCELTAVVLMDRRNVASGGGNRVWTLDQGFGKPDATDAATPRLLTSLTLLEPLDTLFILDRKVKHEALAFVAGDGAAGGVAGRDVLSIECRRAPE